MKTTVELPDELVIRAKKAAAERRTTLRKLIERGLEAELSQRPANRVRGRKLRIPWSRITVKGGLPPTLDLSSREAMWKWIESEK